MAYEPLHHRYRPQRFDQLVGQAPIVRTLSNAIRLKRIAPAYLFTGPRGTGKTSSARILARSLNCTSTPEPTAEPCGQCEACVAVTAGNALDVIEIDAASNTGVDNIRELIERSRFAPVQLRWKVYVVDECHMLSTAAFNALLKTLEEPPPRVVFVLATTDPPTGSAHDRVPVPALRLLPHPAGGTGAASELDQRTGTDCRCPGCPALGGPICPGWPPGCGKPVGPAQPAVATDRGRRRLGTHRHRAGAGGAGTGNSAGQRGAPPPAGAHPSVVRPGL